MNVLGQRVQRVRQNQPLVQCITNGVAMNTAANVLLACGASPAMLSDANESGEFASHAQALTINIGTLSQAIVEGMLAAIQVARQHERPWVLDPVAHFATAFRRRVVAQLLDYQPTVIRGNASEIIALAGGEPAAKGVDSGQTVDEAGDAARLLAQRHHAVVAVTGQWDLVCDNERWARVDGGSAWMPKVTALGCALTCLVGAFLAVDRAQPFEATVAALALYAQAGKQAGMTAHGPGSFASQFLDALSLVESGATDACVTWHR